MFLYKTQPRNPTHNSIINLDTKERLLNMLMDNIDHRDNKHGDVNTLVTDASVVDGLLSQQGYKNILVLPSKVTGRLRDTRYRPIGSAGDHLLPVIHETMQAEGKMYVALPEEHLYRKAYEEVGVSIIEVDNLYKLGGHLPRFKTDVKFDAVVLLGTVGESGDGKYQVNDIKKKLAKHCTEDFDLIDLYRSGQRQLKGNEKDLPTTEQVQRFVSCVNSPRKLYHPVTGLTPHRILNSLKRKELLLYFRLGENIKNVNKFYRVF